MRLLTHNYLQSTVKGTNDGYPLRIKPTSVLIECTPVAFVDYDAIENMLSKIEYNVLRNTYNQLRTDCTRQCNYCDENMNQKEDIDNHTGFFQVHIEVSKVYNKYSDTDFSTRNWIDKILPAPLPESIPSYDSQHQDLTNDLASQEHMTENSHEQGKEPNDNNNQYDISKKTKEAFLSHVYGVLFDIHIQEGALICPATGRVFPIKDGIPNMILHEDEL